MKLQMPRGNALAGVILAQALFCCTAGYQADLSLNCKQNLRNNIPSTTTQECYRLLQSESMKDFLVSRNVCTSDEYEQDMSSVCKNEDELAASGTVGNMSGTGENGTRAFLRDGTANNTFALSDISIVDEDRNEDGDYDDGVQRAVGGSDDDTTPKPDSNTNSATIGQYAICFTLSFVLVSMFLAC